MKLGTKVKSVKETSRYKKGQVGTVVKTKTRMLGRTEMNVLIDGNEKPIIVAKWHWIAK
mgnify:CR=1 FL=1